MKKNFIRYASPRVEIAEIIVEAGFAQSPLSGAAGGDGTLPPTDFGDL